MDSISLKNSLNARISQSFGSDGTSAKQTKNDNEQKMQSNSAKISKTLAALAVLGVAGVAGALVLRNKNAKGVKDVVSEINQGMGDVTQNLDDVTKAALTSLDEAKNKSSKIVKRFFLNNGEEVKDAILDKGVVKMSDGSLFEGFVDTVNQKGDKVLLTYKNGYPSESFVNGELFKKYSNIKSMPTEVGAKVVEYPRSFGAKVFKMQGDNIEKMYVNYTNPVYDDALRVIKMDSDGTISATDVKEGMIVAKSKIDGLYPEVQIFNNNGEVVRTVGKEGNYTVFNDFFPDGSKTMRGGRLDFDIVSDYADFYQMRNANFIRYYNKGETVPNRVIEITKKGLDTVVNEVQNQNGITKTFEMQIPAKGFSEKSPLCITLKSNGQAYAQAKIVQKDGKYVDLSDTPKEIMREIKSKMADLRTESRTKRLQFVKWSPVQEIIDSLLS